MQALIAKAYGIPNPNIKIVKKFELKKGDGIGHCSANLWLDNNTREKALIGNRSPEYKSLLKKCVAALRIERRRTASASVKENPNNIWKIFNKIVKGQKKKV